MNNTKTLYYYRIDVSKGIDNNKASASKEWDIFHYWYYLNKQLKLQSHACNRCHGLLMMSMNFSNIAILDIKSTDCCCFISGIRKREVINIMENVDLTVKVLFS